MFYDDNHEVHCSPFVNLLYMRKPRHNAGVLLCIHLKVITCTSPICLSQPPGSLCHASVLGGKIILLYPGFGERLAKLKNPRSILSVVRISVMQLSFHFIKQLLVTLSFSVKTKSLKPQHLRGFSGSFQQGMRESKSTTIPIFPCIFKLFPCE